MVKKSFIYKGKFKQRLEMRERDLQMAGETDPSRRKVKCECPKAGGCEGSKETEGGGVWGTGIDW